MVADCAPDGRDSGVFLLARCQAVLQVVSSARRVWTVHRMGRDFKISTVCGTMKATWRPSKPRLFSRFWSRCCGIGLSLLLAVFADRIIQGAMLYKTMLISLTPSLLRWRACCGFSFFASLGVVVFTLWAKLASTGTICSRHACHDADCHGRRLEANFLQLFILFGGFAVHPQVIDRSGRH